LRRQELQSTWAKVARLIGAVLMAGFGSMIAQQMSIAQWQMAGFAIGVLLCALAPAWDLQGRVKQLENELKRARS
jgi:hypothetical protein